MCIQRKTLYAIGNPANFIKKSRGFPSLPHDKFGFFNTVYNRIIKVLHKNVKKNLFFSPNTKY